MIPALPRFRPLVPALVAAAVLLGACSASSSPSTAATVDGVSISDAQLKTDVPLFKFLASLYQQPCGAPSGPADTAAAACNRFVLTNEIQEQVIKVYAATNHVTVPASKVDSTLAQLGQQFGPQLDTLLKSSGVTRTQLHDLAARLLLFQQVQTFIGTKQVTDSQIQQQYDQNKLQYTQLHAEHILLKTKAEAVKIEKQVTSKNFQDLATKFSTDPSAAQNHGDLGTVAASQFDATFVQAALALKPGEISQPVHTQFGWHVILLVSADVTPFDQAKAQIVQQLSGTEFTTWLNDRLKSAKISVNPHYGRFDVATGSVTPITSTSTATPSASPASPGASPGASPTP